MLNKFRAIICPSSGAREYYTDGRCLWYFVLWFSSCRYGVELEVMCPVCRLLLKHLYNTLELLMMGIVLPETCWACNKICNKYNMLHLVGILFPHNNDDARSKSLQIYNYIHCIIDLTQRGWHTLRLIHSIFCEFMHSVTCKIVQYYSYKLVPINLYSDYSPADTA